MAFTDALKEKWAMIFTLFDADKDGILTLAEVYSNGQRLVDYYHIEGKEIDDILRMARFTEEMCNDYSGTTTVKTSFTPVEWILAVEKYWNDHPGLLIEHVPRFFKALFKVMDLNEDSYIDYAEFQYYYKRFGESEEIRKKAELAFKLIDTNGDGQISQEEYLGAYIKYHTDPDITANELRLYW